MVIGRDEATGERSPGLLDGEATAGPTGPTAASDSHIQAVFNAALDAILTTDEGGFIQSLNPAAERIFGHPASSVLGEHLRFLLPDDDAQGPSRREPLNMASVSGMHTELTARHMNGSSFPIELAVSDLPVPDETLYVAVLRDITERRRLEAELRHSQKMETLGQLSTGIAHDFNNLLMTIMGCSDIARGQVASGTPADKTLRHIHDAASSGAAIVRQLMEFGGSSAAPEERHWTSGLDDVIRRWCELLQHTLGSDIELSMQLTAGAVSVGCGATALEQVLMNLAINARQAMPAGGVLTIATSVSSPHHDAGYAKLVVRDTGTGMNETTRARVFEPFFTTKGPGLGTGIGLSTVYSLVKQAQGHIEVESGTGRGAKFTVLLPIVSSRPLCEEPGPSSPAGSGQHVLVVEDEALIRLAVRHYLEGAGYEVLEAGSGPEALELVADPRLALDLLVTDMELPGMTGDRVAAELRSRCPQLAVVYMSAYGNDDLVARGRLEFGVRSLQKPFSRGELLRAVHGSLERRAV